MLAEKPLILALANPDPEIRPKLVREHRPDAIIATGRTRLPEPGQQRPLLPVHLPRRARRGRDRDQRGDEACRRRGHGELARVEASEVVAAAYGGQAPVFGPDYIIPKPFDPRLILEIAPAVATARDGQRRGDAADRGFRRLPRAARPVRVPLRPADAPGVRGGAQNRQRIVYAEGEDERVLRAVQTLLDERPGRSPS